MPTGETNQRLYTPQSSLKGEGNTSNDPVPPVPHLCTAQIPSEQPQRERLYIFPKRLKALAMVVPSQNWTYSNESSLREKPSRLVDSWFPLFSFADEHNIDRIHGRHFVQQLCVIFCIDGHHFQWTRKTLLYRATIHANQLYRKFHILIASKNFMC